METIKDAASIIGLCISAITLLGIIIKPIRKALVRWIGSISEDSPTARAIKNLDLKVDIRMDNVDGNMQEFKDKLNAFGERLDTVERRITKDELYRMKEVLAGCADRCHRHEYLSQHEFEFVCDVYHIYKDILHGNSSGDSNFAFINSYYEAQCDAEANND